jgi:hypothetical protein
VEEVVEEPQVVVVEEEEEEEEQQQQQHRYAHARLHKTPLLSYHLPPPHSLFPLSPLPHSFFTLIAPNNGKIIVFATTINIVNLLAKRMECQAVTSGIAIDFERV